VGEFDRIISDFPNYQLCFIDDGSTDGTNKILEQLQLKCCDRVYVLTSLSNCGKAEAIRKGVNFLLTKSNFDMLGFMDADLSTPFYEIDYMASLLSESKDYEIICGSRIKRMGAKIVRKNIRHYAGRVIATIISIALKMPFYDTQCGAKVMSLNVAKLCFQEPFISTWLFDMEIFKRMQRYFKMQTENIIYEHPLREWVHKEESKVRFTYLFMLPIHLFKIQLRYR